MRAGFQTRAFEDRLRARESSAQPAPPAREKLRYGTYMRFLVLSLGWKVGVASAGVMATALAIAGCSDDGVGTPQSTEGGSATGATSPSDGEGDDAADDGGSAADGDGAGTGPSGTAGDDGATSGGTADDGTGGMPTEPECRDDRDCMVVNDCCSCGAVPVGEEPIECPKNCFQPSCDAIGLFDPVAECHAGTCRLAPKSCNQALVSCDAPTPECPEGTLPEVDGTCWSGECVQVEHCDVVPSCDDCPRGEACILLESQLGPQYACEPIPEDCDKTPTCACMGEVCPEAFDTCVDAEAGISCTCPEC